MRINRYEDNFKENAIALLDKLVINRVTFAASDSVWTMHAMHLLLCTDDVIV